MTAVFGRSGQRSTILTGTPLLSNGARPSLCAAAVWLRLISSRTRRGPPRCCEWHNRPLVGLRCSVLVSRFASPARELICRTCSAAKRPAVHNSSWFSLHSLLPWPAALLGARATAVRCVVLHVASSTPGCSAAQATSSRVRLFLLRLHVHSSCSIVNGLDTHLNAGVNSATASLSLRSR